MSAFPSPLAHEADFTLGALLVRPSLSEVERDGDRHHLEPRVMQVLVALRQARGGVLSRDDLIRGCWNGVIVGEDALNRVIGKLRRLAEDHGAAFAIETLPRIGYRLTTLDEDGGRDSPLAEPLERDDAGGPPIAPRFPPGWTLMSQSWAPPWRSPSSWR